MSSKSKADVVVADVASASVQQVDTKKVSVVSLSVDGGGITIRNVSNPDVSRTILDVVALKKS